MSTNTTYQNLLLHIPHASETIPESFLFRHGTVSTKEDICAFSHGLTDYFTDELFAPRQADPHIVAIVCPHSRCICDVERLPKDPLSEQGCGFLYTFDDRYYGENAECAIEAVRMYNQHQEALRDALCDLCQPSAVRPGNETVLLIDCHSFSAYPTVVCGNPPSDVDICIGYNDDWSRPSNEVIERVKLFFERKGYRTGLNTPFSNSKTVDIPLYYHSLMIEVNKTLYMNEATREKAERFAQLRDEMTELYALLLGNSTPS